LASAVHAELASTAECTVWTEGAFSLAANTVEELHRHLRDSDFGTFIFAPDDSATIKGDLLKVARDNVVYEAGLFSGFLSPERCFIVVPQSFNVHVPTDLLGMTLGHYEDGRTDGRHRSAVANFCRDVETRILKLDPGVARLSSG
jgi:predicted nucleotide-binding protein